MCTNYEMNVLLMCFIYSFLLLTICRSQEINVAVGGNITIKCISTTRNPIWWTFNDENLTLTSEKFLSTLSKIDVNEQLLTETSNLSIIYNLTIFDIEIKDEGNFKCLSHIYSNEILSTYSVKPFIEPEVIDSNSKTIKIRIGEKQTLYCLIKAFPVDNFVKSIKWTKDLINLDGSVYKEHVQIINGSHINSTLEISQAFKKDNGTFACIILLKSQLKREISLLVLDIPHVSIDYVKAVGANRIFLNWTVNDGNDVVQKYFIQYMQEGTPTFTYYNHVIDGKNSSFTLENFQANTNYQLRMSAKNNFGDGPINAYNQWVRTLEKDPIFTPRIETTGSSSSTITIGWQPPPVDILEYVQYYELIIFESKDNMHQIIEEAVYQQNSRNLPYMFDNLKTATVYEFKVRACSDLTKLCGPWSEIVNGTTMDGMASQPSDLKVICYHFNISRRNSVAIKWEYPKIPNGKVTSYLIQLDGITVYRSEGKYVRETWGPKFRSVDEPNRKTAYEGVPSNTNYTVTVSGRTRNKKIGDTATASCSMPVTVPDSIGRIYWNNIKTSDNKNVFKIFMPKISERNGEICCYRIYLVRINNQNNDLPMPENSIIVAYNEVYKINNTSGGTYLAEMFSGSYYRSEVFLGDGKRIFNDEESQAKSDEICRECYNGFLQKNVEITNNLISTLTTVKPKVRDDGKTLPDQLAAVSSYTSTLKTLNFKRIKRSVNHNADSEQHNVITSTESTFYSKLNYDPNEPFDGEIDIESNYTGFVEILVRNNWQNVNTDLILATYSNYFDILSPKAAMDSFDSADDFMLILNIIVQVLCALLVLMLLLLVALCYMHHYYSNGNAQGDEVINLRDSLSRAFCGGRTSNHRHIIGSALSKCADIGPLSKNDIPQAYIIRHKDTDYGFLREYEMLPNRFNDRTTKNSDSKENAYKNRYPDIKAYDQTRVKLSLINSLSGTDYINANFVIGYKERKKFICSQGPMEATVNDFWRMTWEQHLEIIVMLTNLEEYNKAKCAKYWPDKISESQQFGDILVLFTAEHRYSDYLVRHLDISKKNLISNDEGEHRQITQYHYLVWKDFMAPEHPYGIIKFIRQINSDYSVQRGPILVHCSAGVGRTGTLVALDSLIQQLEDEGQVSIFNTVCDLRHQRNYLVQSLKQYIFIYRALLDISQFGNTELQAKFLNSTMENLKQNLTETKEKCKLELEFDKVKLVADETNKSCLVGSGNDNMNKNRSDLVIPYDRNRVILTPISTKENSTYINASFIDGYELSENFIITQDPLDNTIGDFWRMLSEQGVTTLVMISEIGDGPRKCPRYWGDDEIRYDHILIKYVHSESCPYYTRREFNVTNCKNNDTIKVTQFQYNGWPTVEGEVPEVCRGINELVDQAQKHRNSVLNFGCQNPIAVHCSLGTDKSSIFIAMCILVKQLRAEKKIDICTVTRKIRSQRHLMINDYPQYEFLHRAIANYADLHQLSQNSLPDSS